MTYHDFPPFHFFVTVLRHQPDTAHFYWKIWSGRDKDNKLMVDKKNIYGQFLVTPNVFKRKLGYLMEEGLLSIAETQYFYEIDFTRYDDDEEEPQPAIKQPTKEKPHVSAKLTPIN